MAVRTITLDPSSVKIAPSFKAIAAEAKQRLVSSRFGQRTSIAIADVSLRF